MYCRPPDILTHWGRVTHICVGTNTNIGSDNGLSPGRCQAIIWINAGILLIGPLGTNVSENSIGIQTFSFKNMHLNMSSAKWRPFCLGLNELIGCDDTCMLSYDYWQVSMMVVDGPVPIWYQGICNHDDDAWWCLNGSIFQTFFQNGTPFIYKNCSVHENGGRFSSLFHRPQSGLTPQRGIPSFRVWRQYITTWYCILQNSSM